MATTRAYYGHHEIISMRKRAATDREGAMPSRPGSLTTFYLRGPRAALLSIERCVPPYASFGEVCGLASSASDQTTPGHATRSICMP
eukprot:714944-Pleurochrysis_carterae.AAC.1